jgi:hypothetical protein
VDIFAIRRRRLAALIAERFKGNKTAFAGSRPALELKPNYVSRLFMPVERGGKNLGEELARRIEKAHGLDFGWLDRESDTGPDRLPGPPQPVTTADLIRDRAALLAPGVQQAILGLVDAMNATELERIRRTAK